MGLNLLRALADELVRLKVNIIVANQTLAVIAAKHATTEIERTRCAGIAGRLLLESY